MIKVITGERCEFETCMTADALLEEARDILDLDSTMGAVAVIDEFGDIYILDLCLVPIEDARPDVAAYVEALVEDIEDEEGVL